MSVNQKKCLQILSDGSLNFSFISIFEKNKYVVYEKDNRNFHLNRKRKTSVLQSESSLKYKKKYVI